MTTEDKDPPTLEEEFDRFLRLVGGNIQKARHRAGMTQVQAADVVSFRVLVELERGQGNPSLRTLFVLADKLGVSVRDLVETGEEQPLEKPLREIDAAAPRRGRKPKTK
ncbi:helix-turn-helix domain-containing protein [Sorangium cellulosum]|uniref:HTH cro/C1-type domain-containing protein n=1 Tax=Sorangium cellulosum So0157-2 TaxID=1254432 RepID=S4XUI8_SORCE|nr:helix-turn-helix domain-containing protein [Sorangium cellulosum]AGP35545.1 hypothetical protein SCE1572_14005 [Sorangium cellulosum So0157-2]